jgi:phosphate-selective porin OprO and OprP
LCALAILIAPSAQAQSIPDFVIPEWKSGDGNAVIRLRARFVHDLYDVEVKTRSVATDNTFSGDDLRALRLGIDGQLSPKVRIRADANLTGSQVNWSDVYIGYVDSKREFFVGQNYLVSPLESVSRPITALLPEASSVNTAFGLNQRNFGVMSRVKGQNWQVVGGLFHGNLNAGDIFGDDVVRYAQLRASFAPRNTARDVLHFGVNLRVRDAQSGPLLRYTTRFGATNYGLRALDSGALASGDTTLGLEAIFMRGPLLISAEHSHLWADTASGQAHLNGTYVEAAWWLTGEGRRYQAGNGSLNQIKPKRAITEGGPGAIALVARIDNVDQSDRRLGARASRLNAFSLGVSWMPVDYVTFRLAASQSQLDRQEPLPSQNGRAVTARAQFAF